jgi:hypothetical protein
LLNDPFDTKFCLRPVISGDDCCEIMGNHIYDAIQTQQAPKLPKGVSEDLKLRLIQKLSFSTKDQLMEVLRKGNIISLYEQHIDVLDKTSRALLDINYIYCLTEDPANLLMWSHYAEKHQGVVLKFKCIKQMDNIFLAAQKVQYKKNLSELWNKRLLAQIAY